ncbi:hypothetical protein SGPA1_30652 [Streptomyces misionensis JCM 4497]
MAVTRRTSWCGRASSRFVRSRSGAPCVCRRPSCGRCSASNLDAGWGRERDKRRAMYDFEVFVRFIKTVTYLR